MQAIWARLGRLSPVKLAFFGSLLLSLIAVLGVATIGRDGAFYMDVAQKVSEVGVRGAIRSFDWPWFPILLAYTHSLLGISCELAAYLWCTLFMAGTCALLVDVVRQRAPAASYWACLVVLAMPAANQFRFDIIREFGFWFFCMLALWLALRWQVRGGWLRAAAIHVAVLLAALFRLEALVLLPALTLWQVAALRSRAGWLRFLQLNAAPLLAAVLAMGVLLAVGGLSSGRVDYYLGLLNPRQVFAAFNTLSNQFASSLIYDYSRDEAGRIVFFGMLAALLIKFVKVIGPFSLPFLFRGSWTAWRIFWQEFRPFAWGALLYVVVLMLFFVRQQFMISRYVSLLNLLLVPLLAVGLRQWAQSYPRLAKALVGIALLVMLNNVIALGAKKTQIVDAGRWVAQHIDPAAPVFYDDGRIAYYAGRGYPRQDMNREAAMGPDGVGRYRYYLLAAREDEAWLQSWLAQQHKRILARFANRKGDSVLVIGD